MTTLSKFWQFRGALLVAAMQAVPVDLPVDREGRVAIAFGISGDRYNQQRFGCDGSVSEERVVESQTRSVTIDVERPGPWSYHVFGGNTTSDAALCVDPTCSLPPAFKGGFGGARIGYRSAGAQVEFGLISMPDVDIDYNLGTHAASREIVPSLRFRFGSVGPGRRNFQMMLNGIATPGGLPMTTIGMGFSGSEANPARGFIGIGLPPYSAAENGSTTVRGDFAIPLGRRAELAVGFGGWSDIQTGTAGLRLLLGGGR
jgi:hypothetical protein